MSFGKGAAALCALLIGFTPPIRADQTFRISRDLDGISTSLRAIQDFETGNILALITQLDANNRSFGRVHGVLLRNQPQTQNFAVGNPRLISPDAGWQGRANGIYNPVSNRFVVVWDNGGVETPTGSSGIFARQVAGSGKPKGGVLPIIDNGDFNSFPVLISNATPQFGNGTGGVLNIIIWSGQRTPGAADQATHGLNAAPASITKKNVSVNQTKHKLIESNKDTGIGPFPERGKGYRNSGGGPAAESFGVAISGFRYVIAGGFRLQGFSYVLSADPDSGAITVDQRFDMPLNTLTPSSIGVAGGPDPWERQLMLAIDSTTSNVRRVLFEGELFSDNMELAIAGGPASTAIVMLPLNHHGNYGAPAAKPVFGHIVAAARDGWVYAQRITTDGKALKKPVKIFSHGNKLVTMQVYRIDREGGAFNTLILWQKEITGELHEAWAYFTNLK